MQTLRDYLNSKFLADTTHIKCYFETTHGVDVKVEGNLYLFKYDMLAVKWSDITKQCRGTILRYTPESWQYCTRPWDKFYTYGQSECPILKTSPIGDGYKLTTKFDGTCIQLWYDNHNKQWRVSTLGTITTQNVNSLATTFADLFWPLFHKTFQLSDFSQDVTWLFELCTTENKIVTAYSQDHIKLLSGRHTLSGRYSILEDKYGEDLEVLKTGGEIADFTERQTKVQTEYSGVNPEGYVLYLDQVPVAKFKNSAYLTLHSAVGGDLGHTINCIIAAFLVGNLDDILGVLPASRTYYANSVIQWWGKVCSDMLALSEAVRCGAPYLSNKEYAIAVQGLVTDKFFVHFFYRHKKEVIDGDVSLGLLREWLTQTGPSGYTKIKDSIKLQEGTK